MAANDDAGLYIPLEADPQKLEAGLKRALTSLKKTEAGMVGMAEKVEKSLNKMFNTGASASAGNKYSSLMRKAAQVTNKFASANVLAGAEIKRLQAARDKGLLSQKLYNQALQEQKDKMFAASAQGRELVRVEAEKNAALARGVSVTKSVRTATEKYEIELRELKGLLKTGAISQETYNRAISRAKIAHGGAAAAAQVQTGVYARLAMQVKGLSLGYYALGAVMTAVFAASGVKNHLDGYSSIQSKLKLIVGEHGNVNEAMRKNFELAKDTYSSFDSTVDAYARISRSVKQLNKSETERFQVVSNINKALSINGSTAEQAKASIMQLGQALASDRFGGDEYKSVSENGQRVIQAIADGLDVSIGKLREMSIAGELTSNTVFNALLSQTQKLNTEFENIAKRIDQSMVGVTGSMTLTIGKLDEIYGISGKVVAGFDSMAAAIEAVPEYLTAIELAAGAAAGIIGGGLVAALYSVSVAALASPLAPFVLAAGALGLALAALNAALSDTEGLSYSLSNADISLANTTSIATKAQYGLTKALRARGREMAALDLVNAGSLALEAKGLQAKAQKEFDFKKGHHRGGAEGMKRFKIELDAANKLVNKSIAQQKQAIKNYNKIENAKIIDFSTGSSNAGGGVAELAKKQASEVVTILKSIETPIQKLEVQGKKLKVLLDAGKLNKSDYKKALQLSVDTYHQDVKNAEHRTKGYQLQQEANGLLLANLTDSQRLEKSIAKINELKLAGKLTDEQAASLIAGEKTRAVEKTGGGGGSASTLAANDNEAMTVIGEYGSAADKARVAALGYGQELEKINGLLVAGKIDQDTYAAAVAGIESVYEKAKLAATDYGQVVSTIMDSVKGTLKSVFSEIFKNGKITMSSLVDMVNNAMSSIFDKVMGMAIDGMFSAFGFSSGGSVGLAKGGIVQSFATGGMVRGAGTSISDSIPARLSKGEFVINANATAQHRALLEQINSGNGVALARGGMVGGGAANNNSAAVAVSVNVQVINSVSDVVEVKQRRNNKGDVLIELSRRVAGQIAKDEYDGIGPISGAIMANQA